MMLVAVRSSLNFTNISRTRMLLDKLMTPDRREEEEQTLYGLLWRQLFKHWSYKISFFTKKKQKNNSNREKDTLVLLSHEKNLLLFFPSKAFLLSEQTWTDLLTQRLQRISVLAFSWDVLELIPDVSPVRKDRPHSFKLWSGVWSGSNKWTETYLKT